MNSIKNNKRIFFSFIVFLTIFGIFNISCSRLPREKREVKKPDYWNSAPIIYGDPAKDKIQVLIGGAILKQGIYCFKEGSTAFEIEKMISEKNPVKPYQISIDEPAEIGKIESKAVWLIYDKETNRYPDAKSVKLKNNDEVLISYLGSIAQ